MRIFFLLLLVICPACHKREALHSDSAKLPEIQVTLATAEAMTMPDFEPVVGTVRPRLEATVSADISGRILEFLVVSGQKVKKGDVIARLDAEEIIASQARAKAALDQMELEVKRHKKLLESNATSRSRYEQADAAEKMARANLVKINASLDKAIVRAPFSGRITRKFMDTGDLAILGRALVNMEDPTSLRLETAVAESLAGKLTLGQSIKVQVEAAQLSLTGKISELEPSADSASRTFTARIDLPSSPGLRAGLFGRAWIPRGETALLLIPQSSVVRRGQMELVFVAAEGKAKLRLVRTVPYGKDQISVLSGISEGDQVVLTPPTSLEDGSPLKTN